MATYKSGRVTTGVQSGINVEVAESEDVEAAKPRTPEKGMCFKSRQIPLNLVGPKGEDIPFNGGYFVTTNKAIIEYLKENYVGTHCDIC